VVPGPRGFPPLAGTRLGAVGEPGCSPLVELPGGSVVNAPHIANASGRAEVVALDTRGRRVRYAETLGFQGDEQVRYASTEATDPVAAALEDVSFAPALAAAPFVAGDGTDSARASLAAFVNGQTGARNPQRQGLDSAILDGLDPLNVLAWNPTQGRYSPLWDVHLARWSDAGVATRTNTRQENFFEVADLGRDDDVTAPNGGRIGPSGFIVDCPVISRG
jgi:hypothetical protein